MGEWTDTRVRRGPVGAILRRTVPCASTMRLSITAAALLSLLTGCGGLSASRTVLSSRALHATPYPGRVEFHADLTAAGDSGHASEPGAVAATLDLTFRDAERFEYRLVVWNAATTYTTIALVGAGDPAVEMDLAIGLEVRGAYAQVRGTGVVSTLPDNATLLERLRANPGRFSVRLLAATGSVGLEGRLE